MIKTIKCEKEAYRERGRGKFVNASVEEEMEVRGGRVGRRNEQRERRLVDLVGCRTSNAWSPETTRTVHVRL